tara:strand:- start:94 stop:267 length:174 start_codon:yes stop_codon:yes gene_type:complete
MLLPLQAKVILEGLFRSNSPIQSTPFGEVLIFGSIPAMTLLIYSAYKKNHVIKRIAY